jgi:hypothetical protein
MKKAMYKKNCDIPHRTSRNGLYGNETKRASRKRGDNAIMIGTNRTERANGKISVNTMENAILCGIAKTPYTIV